MQAVRPSYFHLVKTIQNELKARYASLLRGPSLPGDMPQIAIAFGQYMEEPWRALNNRTREYARVAPARTEALMRMAETAEDDILQTQGFTSFELVRPLLSTLL